MLEATLNKLNELIEQQAKRITELEAENKAVLRRAETAEEDLQLEESKTTKLEAELEKHRWIPVGERVPKDVKDVLSLRYSTCNMAYYDEETQRWYEASTNLCLDKITYWKPTILP